MEFYGVIRRIIGYPHRPTFIIEDRETGRDWTVEIIDAHGIRPINHASIDLFLNGNLLTDNKPEEIKKLVIIEVHAIMLNQGLFIGPKDYVNKQVYVHPPHHII